MIQKRGGFILIALLFGSAWVVDSAQARGKSLRKRPAPPKPVVLAPELSQAPLNVRDSVFFSRNESFPVLGTGRSNGGFSESVTVDGHWVPKELLKMFSSEALNAPERCTIRFEAHLAEDGHISTVQAPPKGSADTAFTVIESTPGQIKLQQRPQEGNTTLPIRDITCTSDAAKRAGRKLTVSDIQGILKSSAAAYPIDPAMIAWVNRWNAALAAPPISTEPTECPPEAATSVAEEAEPPLFEAPALQRITKIGVPAEHAKKPARKPMTQRQVDAINQHIKNKIKPMIEEVRARMKTPEAQAAERERTAAFDRVMRCQQLPDCDSEPLWKAYDDSWDRYYEVTGQNELDAAFQQAYDMGGQDNRLEVRELLKEARQDSWSLYPTIYEDDNGLEQFGGFIVTFPDTGQTFGPFGGGLSGSGAPSKPAKKPNPKTSPSPKVPRGH